MFFPPNETIRVSLMIPHVSVQCILINESSVGIPMNGVKFVLTFKGETQPQVTIRKLLKTSIKFSALGTKSSASCSVV